MKLVRITLLAMFVGTAFSCTPDANVKKLPENSTILAFGDSLTRGKGTSESLSYPSVLAELTGIKVVNEGVSGELSSAGLRRLPGVLESVKPNLVILMHGGNDILQNRSAVELKANINSMINLARKAGSQVLLVCLPEKTLFSSCSSIYKDLASENSLILESGIIAKLLKDPTMKSDRVHFNQAGYRAIAEKLVVLMQEEELL